MKILLTNIMYEKKLSVRQVSKMTGVPTSSLNDIMNEKSSPRLDTLEQIARGLKVRIQDLYESPYK